MINDMMAFSGYFCTGTGGGCEAWEKVLTPKSWVWITDDNFGTPTDFNEQCFACYYWDDGEHWTALCERGNIVETLKEVESFIAHIKDISK